MTAATVAPADQPVADKLHELLDAKATKFFDRKAERTAIEKFYTARELCAALDRRRPLNAQAKGVIARLKDAAADGLNPADYPVPDFAAASSPDQLAEADLKLTASMMDYARQAQSGRMHWSQVSGDISYPEHPINPEQVLTNVTTAKDASAALDSYNPPQKLYRELKKKLAELRGVGEGPVTQIADGPALKYVPARGKKHPAVEMEDSRVPMLRAKLGITENADDTHYDAKVAAAVRKFQANADLKATGVLDERTVKAINSPKRDRQIDTVIVNMERWRWLPRELGAPSLGNAYAILNIPDYSLKVMQHGAQVWSTRVVVGKPGIHATPLLTETMKYITVNPTWNVPPSIIYNEYLPALQQDPTVLERMGLKLERDRSGGIHISQPPGERNALGRIRFNFPNKFLVYQHDTPDKYLFAKEERAFSHGCMRVQNPDQYAATLLGIEFPQRALHAGENPQHVWPERDRHQIPDADSRQHHVSDRVRGSMPANCRSARTSTAATPRCWRCSATPRAGISRRWSPMPSRTIPVPRAIFRKGSRSTTIAAVVWRRFQQQRPIFLRATVRSADPAPSGRGSPPPDLPALARSVAKD